MGPIEAGMLMPPGYEGSRMNEKNAGVRWLPVVGNTHVAGQKVKGEAVPQALKRCIHRSGKMGFCYHCWHLGAAESWIWRVIVR